MPQPTSDTSQAQSARPLFSRGRVIHLAVAFVVILGLANVISLVAARILQHYGIAEIDRPKAWPLSIFVPRIPLPIDLLVTAAVFGAFALAGRYLQRVRYRPWHVAWIGLVLIVGSNLVQGWANGFVTPTSGTSAAWRDRLHDPTKPIRPVSELEQRERHRPLQYYHDAQDVRDAGAFVRDFHRIQPDLRMHSRTHPPGAVLVFHALDRIFGSPAAISIAIAILSVALTVPFLYGSVRSLGIEPSTAGYATFLFLLLPAVQIYYLASLDALIAALLIGALCFFLQPGWPRAVFGTMSLLVVTSFLTFGWVFLVPVLAGWEILRRRSFWRLPAVVAGVAVFYVGLYGLSGFDYWQAFRTASAIENPHGLRLIGETASYFFTQTEGIAEILVFLGPYLLVLMGRGLRVRGESAASPLTLFWLAAGTLLAMLAVGAFRTGETARACLYIYPFLLLPVVLHLQRCDVSEKGRTQLLTLVFVQTLAMQLAGSYFW